MQPGPPLDRRVVTIAEGREPGAFGSHLAYPVWAAQSDGHLRVAYRRATTHVSFDGAIVSRTSRDAGATWGPEQTLFAAPEAGVAECRDLDLVALSDGRLLAGLTRRTAAGAEVAVACSDDDGLTWTMPALAATRAATPALVERRDGALLMALHSADEATPPRISITVHVSLDRGATWGPLAVAAGPDATGGLDCVEAQIALLADDGILMVLHTEGPFPQRYWRTVSRDGGATWSALTELGFTGSNRLGLCTTAHGVAATYWDGSRACGRRWSVDAGRTWSAYDAIAEQAYPPGGTQWSSPGVLSAAGGLGIAFAWESSEQDRSSVYFVRVPVR